MKTHGWILIIALCSTGAVSDTHARTVHRCLLDGVVSLSTAAEPGSLCTAVEIDDNDPATPNVWGALGEFSGTLYRREQDGRTVYGTRELPGSLPVLGFSAKTPSPPPARGKVGALQLDAYADAFRENARIAGVDDALLRAVAHAESGFDRLAESPKGAQGVMQLMPATAAEYGVSDPFASGQSIRAGALHLSMLMKRFGGDLALVAAAYNAGIGALQRHGGIPPYAETEAYVEKVLLLHQRYRDALAAS